MAIKVKHIKAKFIDERGSIELLVDQNNLPIKSVLRITGKAGAIRGNHYHKKGFHYYFVESGKCQYFEKPANKLKAKIETVILMPGDMVLVRPGVINATKFLEDSVIYHLDTQRRGQNHYESNTVRVRIIQ